MALDVDRKAWASVDVLRLIAVHQKRSPMQEANQNNRQEATLQTISHVSEVQAANE